MTNIIFVTGNYRKVQSAQSALDKFGIKVIQNNLDTPEIQDKDVRKVAEYSAKFAAEKLNKAVIKVDVGFAIDALRGFPGPFSKFVGEWLGYKKILKLLEDEPNKKAKFVEAIAYCEPKGKPVSFKTETKGSISNKPLGENGWGIDKIFIPSNFKTTLANLSDDDRIKVWNTDHWNKLADFITNKR